MNKIVALDIGATNMRFAIVDEKLNIVDVKKIKTVNKNVKSFIKIIIENTKDLVSSHDGINAIVVGVPGYVNSCEIIEELPNLHLYKIDLKKQLIKHFEMPVFIINDAVSAGYAEALHGAGKDYHRVYYMTISSGVGGAFFVDGKETLPFKENGHMLFKYKEKYYDAEHLLSGYGLVFLAKINDCEVESSSDFFIKFKQDKRLMQVYQDWLQLFKEFFITLETIYQPDIFVIGGGVVLSSDSFLDDFKKMIKTPITLAKFDQNVGIIGSGTYGFLKGNIL